MKISVKSLAFLLLLLLSFGSTQGVPSTAIIGKTLEVYTPSQLGTPVLLKLNEWYLLQSYPISPYRDELNEVMVPLRVIGELLGGQVYLNESQRSGLMIATNYDDYTSHKLEFAADFPTVQVDQSQIETASLPYWLRASGELIRPPAKVACG